MRLQVISLNLWNGGRIFKAAMNFLLDQQADIMLLQEAYNGNSPLTKQRFRTVQILTKLFPDYDSYFSPAFLDLRKKEGKIEHGQLILSKFPLKKTSHRFFDVPYGAYDHDSISDFTNFPTLVQTALIEIKGQTIKLLNTHGPVNNDGTADTPRRLKMKNTILEEIKNHPRIIMSGDFNVRPQTQTIGDLEKKLVSVFKDKLITSFNLQQKNLDQYPGFASAVVDMMFVTPNIKVINQACPDVNISDHLPLVATFDV